MDITKRSKYRINNDQSKRKVAENMLLCIYMYKLLKFTLISIRTTQSYFSFTSDIRFQPVLTIAFLRFYPQNAKAVNTNRSDF